MINAGVQGYGPVDEWLFFDAVASAFEPDIVLIVAVRRQRRDRGQRHGSVARRRPFDDGRAPDAALNVVRRLVRSSMVLQLVRAALGPAARALQRRRRPSGRCRRIWTIRRRTSRTGSTSRGARSRRSLSAPTRSGRRPASCSCRRDFRPTTATTGDCTRSSSRAGGELDPECARPHGFARRSRRWDCRRSICCRFSRRSPTAWACSSSATIHLTPRGHEVVADALFQFLDVERARCVSVPRWSSTRSSSSGSFSSSTRCIECCRTARRTGCSSRRATTSTPPGTGGFSACSSGRRSSISSSRAISRRTTAPGRRKLALVLSLAFNLGMLGFFKYFNFFADSLVARVRVVRLAARSASR